MSETIPKTLLSPLFIIFLGLLLLNDFVLKAQFHNFLTGKLSDFVGLFVFSLFFIAFFPRKKLSILISIAILFTFWKSPYSESLINCWNSVEIITIWRVVDYTDLFALIVLPLAYFYSNHRQSQNVNYLPLKRAIVSCIVLISIFAFLATSFTDEHSFWIDKNYEFDLTKSQFEDLMRQNYKISELEIKPTNQYPNLKHDPRESFLNFRLNHKICDTSNPTVYLFIKDLGQKIIIESISIRVRCSAFADRNTNTAIKEYEPAVKSIFEIEVIEKLKEYSKQKP